MLDLVIIIVTWNVRALALDTLRSLYADLAESGLNHQVIVVDNASHDGTVEAIRAEFPQAQIFASAENLGFVRGNNRAMREIGFPAGENLPKAVYLLNPDTVTQIGATRALYDALMRDSRAGLVGARLTYADGSFQYSAFGFPGLRQLWTEFFPTPGRWIEGKFNGRYPRQRYAGEKPFAVDFVLGATMMLRCEVVQQVGMFDEAFFMYCEEIDWAKRIRDAGWAVQCVPAAHVVHVGGQSTGQVRPQSAINLWTSRLRLYEKHHPRWKVWAARRLIAWGMRKKRRELNPITPQNQALDEAYRQIEKLAQL